MLLGSFGVSHAAIKYSQNIAQSSSANNKLQRSNMSDPSAKFPLLFTKQWNARALDVAIAALNIEALTAEYHGLQEVAPRRALRGKEYFVGHTRTTPGTTGSNRREELLARELCAQDPRWPWPDGGRFRLLDYQVPLKAQQNDTRIGKIDLLGLTDAGRLVVIELKVDGPDGQRSDPPPSALMEALRYTAILQANQLNIANEAKAKFGVCVSDKEFPAIVLLGTEAWWKAWRTLEAAGAWTDAFSHLLNQIETHIGTPVKCMATTAAISGCSQCRLLDLGHTH